MKTCIPLTLEEIPLCPFIPKSLMIVRRHSYNGLKRVIKYVKNYDSHQLTVTPLTITKDMMLSGQQLKNSIDQCLQTWQQLCMIPIVIPNMILQHESTPTITRRLVKNYSFQKNCSGLLRDSPTLNPSTFLRLSKDNNNKKCCLCPCLPCLSPSWTKKLRSIWMKGCFVKTLCTLQMAFYNMLSQS